MTEIEEAAAAYGRAARSMRTAAATEDRLACELRDAHETAMKLADEANAAMRVLLAVTEKHAGHSLEVGKK